MASNTKRARGRIEKLIEELELEGANSCVTPGLKQLPDQIDSDQPLGPERFKAFRGLAARANYLSADRPDCQR